MARALAHAERERLDFLSLLPTLETKTFGERLMIAAVATAGFCYLPGWLMNVPGARLFGGGGGIFNLIRRDLFDEIGGHAALKNSVVDDIQLGRNARMAEAGPGIAMGARRGARAHVPRFRRDRERVREERLLTPSGQSCCWRCSSLCCSS